MKKLVCCLSLVLLFTLFVHAQDVSIDDYEGRLPEDTLFYLKWNGLAELESLRATNPLLRLLDTEEMKINWRLLKDYFRRMEELQKKSEEKQKQAEESEKQAKKSKKKATWDELEWGDIVRLAQNPGLIAAVMPPVDAEAQEDPTVVFLYDVTGQEEFLEELERRLVKEPGTKREYEFEGLTVIETLDAEGKPTSYEARIGRWLAAGSRKEAAEAWFRALQAAPERSLRHTEAYCRARTLRNPSAQVEFYADIQTTIEWMEKLPDLQPKQEEEQAGEPQPQTDVGFKKAVEAFGFKDWEFAYLGFGIDPKEIRYNATLFYGPERGDSPHILAPPVAAFRSLSWVPADTLSYSVSQVNVGAIWAFVERALKMMLPPQQVRLVAGIQGMIEGLMGMTIQDVAETWGPEYAEVDFLPEGEEEVRKLRAMQVRDRERMLTLLRNLVPLFAGQLEVKEFAGEEEESGVTFMTVAPRADAGEEPLPPVAVIALTDEWLLAGSHRADVGGALKRRAGGSSLKDSAALRELRAQLPAELSTFAFVDIDRWLEKGNLEKALNEFGEQMTEQILHQRRAGQEKEEEEEKEGEEQAKEPEQPKPEQKTKEKEESQEQAEQQELEKKMLELEFPLLKFPRGFLYWFFNGTTRDARGVHHLGILK